MKRRVPVIATLLVAVAVLTMIALGVWQLQRLTEKEQLLARYERAATLPANITWPRSPREYPEVLYRQARLTCARVDGIEVRAGRSAQGTMGWAHEARCRLADGNEARIALGWSADPGVKAGWRGGVVSGLVGPAGLGVKLVAAPAQAGLQQLAAPDPRDLPNNHLAYAVQWFLFAATALIVYVLALRGRWRASGS